MLLQNLVRIADRRYTGRIVKDLLFVSFVGGFYFGVVPALGIPLSQTVVPMILLFPLVFAWRAVSDHYGIPAIERAAFKGPVLDVDAGTWHRDRKKRQREVTGWVVRTSPWLEWLWSHVNYHEVHHKYPWLSHRYLPQVFAATRASQPYLVVDGYWRSFFNLSRRNYYESRETARPFLTTPDW
jgi:fatty acid desaturase